MKTKLVLFLSVVIFSSCLVVKNKTITDERTERKEFVGKVTREGFRKKEFKIWFDKGYAEYNPDKEVINKLNDENLYKNVNIKVIFGTWCGDSRRELPRFFKIVDLANIPESVINMIAVDTKKSSRNKNLEGIEFSRIPTFIFYDNGKEIGRIVESTTESLEKDMLKILEKK